MAQKPPKGKDARPVTNEALQVKVDVDVRDFYTRLQNRASELLTDAQQRGLTGEPLADYVVGGLADLSDKPIEAAGRAATSEAHNLGRNLEVQRRLATLAGGTAVRSEILDDDTCVNCRKLDGAVVEINGPVISISAEGEALLREFGIDPYGPDAYFALLAPNFCLGEDLCRGLMYYRREEAAA